CALRSAGMRNEDALADLHALLLRAARFEVARRRATLSHLRGDELEDIALEAADDALVAVLARLDDFEGRSRFTTWAYKFALLEAAVKLRRRAWQAREIPLAPESWERFACRLAQPGEQLEEHDELTRVIRAVDELLTPHQRRVLVALA